MSADNGYVIRKNDAGKYVLQMYFASDEEYPDIDSPRAMKFNTLEEATLKYAELDTDEYPSEYGLRILLPELDAPRSRNKIQQEIGALKKQYDEDLAKLREDYDKAGE